VRSCTAPTQPLLKPLLWGKLLYYMTMGTGELYAERWNNKREEHRLLLLSYDMDAALPTLLQRLQANMYLLYIEMRKGKKTGVVVQSMHGT
jgi:hypothetical protein